MSWCSPSRRRRRIEPPNPGAGSAASGRRRPPASRAGPARPSSTRSPCRNTRLERGSSPSPRKAGTRDSTPPSEWSTASFTATRSPRAIPTSTRSRRIRRWRPASGSAWARDVAEGHWTRAVELPAVSPARGSQPVLRATERLGALLGGRDVALAAELLVRRARLDLDHDRAREAALQMHAALSVALADLESWRDVGDLAVRLEELRRLEPGVAAAAGAALEGTPRVRGGCGMAACTPSDEFCRRCQQNSSAARAKWRLGGSSTTYVDDPPRRAEAPIGASERLTSAPAGLDPAGAYCSVAMAVLSATSSRCSER